ncbi:hypothetical protein [Dyella thiooxydans]|nr:hypothetical protein [Dyella thiooxydans]
MSSPTREMTASDIHNVYRMDAARPAKPAARKRKAARKAVDKTASPARKAARR